MKHIVDENLVKKGNQILEETFLTEHNILMIKRMFKDKISYSYYIRSLWILRNLTSNLCEVNREGGVFYDKDHQLFPILKMTNELIGALYRENASVDFTGENVNCIIDGEVFNIYTLD